MLLANLREVPDSTWMMEYVVGWTLLYRTDKDMLHFAERLTPTPARVGITQDATGQCMFLDVTKGDPP